MFRAKAQSSGRELVSDPITRAFAVSLLLHFLVVGGVELGRGAGFWKVSVLPKFLQSNLPETVAETAARRQKQQLQAERQAPEAELIFVDVDPTQAQPEAPKDAKYYSSQNTVAANTSEGQKDKPKLDGKQDQIAKVKDTLRPDPNALHPAPQPAPKQPETLTPAPPQKEEPKRTEEKVAPNLEPEHPEEEQAGETLLARATPRPEPRPQSNRQEQQPERKHPRTLAEAKANKGILEGKQMKQEGGVPRLSLDSSLDVKATPFGAYDTAFIMAVQARWFSLLEERNFVGNESGKVVVEFRLHQDGSITDTRVTGSQVSEILSWYCQRAVLDPAPYKPFPSDLRRMMDNEYREIRFTFYYNQ